MKVNLDRRDHYWILECEGFMINLPPGPINEVTHALVQGARDIIIDLSKVTFIGPEGVKALEESQRTADRHASHIGIAGPGSSVRRILHLNGVGQQIPVFYNLDEAVRRLDLIDYQPENRPDDVYNLLIWHNEIPIAGHLRKVFRDYKGSFQFRVFPVRDSDDAIHSLLSERIECILVDASIQMFRISGFIEKLRMDDTIPEIPIIVIASEDRMGEADLMVRHGVYDIIRFPVNPVEAAVRLQTTVSFMKDHRPYFPPKAMEKMDGISRV